MRLHLALFVLLTTSCAAPPAAKRASPPSQATLSWIRPSDDTNHFVRADSGDRVVMWGFNYDRDDSGRLLEDYWENEWETVAQDFAEMKALHANVVRVHLQLAKFMDTPDRANVGNLQRLSKLVGLAEQTKIYLDITGLGCYHKQDVPAWYDALDEARRWDVQARFWKEIAAVCRASPAIFCYDLMNEPILTGGANPKDWLAGPPLAGKYYVQRITTNAAGRTDEQIAQAWVQKLTSAIRSIDDRHMITVGEIPWAQVFKGARPLFHSTNIGAPLDFVSVHFYPKPGDLEPQLAALKVYELGKPLVIEEIFPLEAGIDNTVDFIDESRPFVDGWMSFYWGKTAEENKAKADIPGAFVGQWIERFSSLSPKARSASDE